MKLIQKISIALLLLSTIGLNNQLFAAERISNSNHQPLGYTGAVDLNTSDLSNGAKMYRGWLETGAWQGDLIEYNVSSTGAKSTTIDISGSSPTQGGSGAATDNWSAAAKFALNEVNPNYWTNGRQIITHNGSQQVPFRWNNLSPSQQQALDTNAYNNGAPRASSDLLDFIRGDRSNEFGGSGSNSFRARLSLLGDIMHGNPEFVNASSAANQRVYVGANDGMLHAFNASNGNEEWAYIPSMLINKLPHLAVRPFYHSYFVDGTITVNKANLGSSASPNWRNVLVGSLGAGGKGIFALDVNSPSLNETSNTGNNRKILWEIDSSDATFGNHLGYIYNSPQIAKLNDGDYYAVIGNGMNSSSNNSMLLLINLVDSSKNKALLGAYGIATNTNGLSGPALVDTDYDGDIDLAYAGDLKGNMIRFDLSSSNPASWAKDYILYNPAVNIPITTPPDVSDHPESGFLVHFGTGRLLEPSDVNAAATANAIITVRDTGTAPSNEAHPNLLTQTLSVPTDYTSNTITESVKTITTSTAIDWNTHTGWKVELNSGFRLITPLSVRNSRVKAMVTNPDGYQNWYYELDYSDGGSPDQPIFDLNADGSLDINDSLDTNNVLVATEIPVAIRVPDGAMSEPAIGFLNGNDIPYVNNLTPPNDSVTTVIGCTSEVCSGGIAGGHFDLDTDTSLGGKTDKHKHNYDDITNRTYADYFDMNPPSIDGLAELHSTVPTNQDYILLIANGDLSPGATLTVGDVDYNAVQYQRLIHEKLASWNGTGPLTDNPTSNDSGNSLFFKSSDIAAMNEGSGTIRIGFNSLSILSGGLHATETSCVKDRKQKSPHANVNVDGEMLTHGRWRNGALTIHAVKKSIFNPANWQAGTNSALEQVTVQAPTDLATDMWLTINGNAEQIILKDGSTHYGGLRAKSNGFLYESTLFWHYAGGRCYGESGYSSALTWQVNSAVATSINTALSNAGYANETALAAAITDYETLGCSGSANSGVCSGYQQAIEIEYMINTRDGHETSTTITTNVTHNMVTLSSSDATGNDSDIHSDNQTENTTISTGRRAWVDITPQ